MAGELDKSKRIPLYVQCEDYLLESIRSGKYSAGEFLPPERDLSSRLGVNRLTLRRAISALIKKGLIENIPGAGNRIVGPHAQPFEKKTVVTCLMLRTQGSPALSPYYAELFEGLHHGIENSEYDLTFTPVSTDALWKEDGAVCDVSGLVRTDFAGVVSLGGIPDELVKAYEHVGVPVVMLDKPSCDPAIPSIMPDNEKAAALACRHLLDLGHRKIGYIEGGSDIVSDMRKAGLASELAKEGLRLDEKLVITGGYEVMSARWAVDEFIREHGVDALPTAFLAVNDEGALGTIKSLTQHDLRVPDDVSIIGFDDIPWAEHYDPPLTTLRIPRIEMGEWAMRLLIDRVNGNALQTADIQLQSKLIIRESTCEIRA